MFRHFPTTPYILSGWPPKLRASSAAAKSLQSCPTLCDPIDGSPPGSPIPGILQARTLESVAIFFSDAWQWKRSCSVMSDPQRPHGLQPTRLLRPWDFPGKSTGGGFHCLLPGLHLPPSISKQNLSSQFQPIYLTQSRFPTGGPNVGLKVNPFFCSLSQKPLPTFIIT